MAIELKIPELGESITEVEIGEWLKTKGDTVQKDEPVVALESDKATVELPAPVSGTISDVIKKKGDTAAIGEVIAYIEKDGRVEPGKKATETGKQPRTAETVPALERIPAKPREAPRVMPAAERALAQHELRAEQVKPTGPGNRLLKEDVLRHAQEGQAKAPETKPDEKSPSPLVSARAPTEGREEEVVAMTRLRRTVAERLVEAQRTAAMLTTFNEIDMSAVMSLRKEHGEAFQKKYNAKLGIMSFFVKASIEALKAIPQVNAEVRATNIVYRNYYDIGVAIGGGKGLVVPVLRNAERLSFAEIEMAIGDFARRAQENKLKPDELQGGTFTISNGGVYGSLLSTPILNPPQSGILGLHAIQDRPVAREGNVVIRSMMYVALTYDHRIVDGREAVTFLRRIKEVIENPARLLIEV
jgi:2-oxoglutarate dehydrogenase E2 component (dihydrolipoamide succinyltransferase)